MVRINILYPNTPGSRFDMSYYIQTHMPRAIELLSAHPGYQGVSVEQGVSGAAPGSAATYAALCHFQFSSGEAFMEAFIPNAPELQGDMPNYTDVQPQIQISTVLLAQ